MLARFPSPPRAPPRTNPPLPSCSHGASLSGATPRLRFFNCLVAARRLRATTSLSSFQPFCSRQTHSVEVWPGTDFLTLLPVPDKEPAVQKRIKVDRVLLDFQTVTHSTQQALGSAPATAQHPSATPAGGVFVSAAQWSGLHATRALPGRTQQIKIKREFLACLGGRTKLNPGNAQPGFCDKRRPLRSTPDQV